MKKFIEKQNTQNIAFWLESFKDAKQKADKINSQIKEAKEQIVNHVKDQSLCSDEKKTFRFDNGTTVTRSTKISAHLDQDKIDLDWIDRFLSTESADAISITIDHRKLCKTDEASAALLEEAGYEEVVTLSYTVNLSSAENA